MSEKKLYSRNYLVGITGLGAIITAIIAWLFFKPALFPDEPIPDQSAVNPEYGQVYLVDISAGPTYIDFYFSGMVSKRLIGATVQDKRDYFESYLKKIADGPPYPTPGKWKRLLKRCKATGSNGTIQCKKIDTGLSINNDKKSFIAFALNPEKNWSYIEETKNHEDVIKKFINSSKNYGDVRKMDRNGVVVKEDNPQNDTVIAYFTADGEAASKYGDYEDYFNLYTVIKDNDGALIPIVIDPDVRYPGGNDGG